MNHRQDEGKDKFLNVRLFVYESGPVLWFGNNHGAAIVRVEPLD